VVRVAARYAADAEFVEDGVLMGMALRHPNGGPCLALRLDPEHSAGLADFDFFAIGVPGRPDLQALADRLTALGETHAGVHFAAVGWILPMLHDPDGHEVRFYTTEQHTSLPADRVTRLDQPRETAERRGAPIDAEAARA
jgi:hypothetical protein